MSRFQASLCGHKRAVTVMTACRLRRCLLYAVLATSIVLCVVLWAQNHHHFIDTYDCPEDASKLYLEELCGRYASGHIAGSLCEPLCITREIHIQKCIGAAHQFKRFVLQAEWKSKSLIVKSFRNLHPSRKMSSYHLSEMHDGIDLRYPTWNSNLNRETFLRKANITLFKRVFVGSKTNAQSVINLLRESVAAECITKHHMSNGQKLRNIEALNCWQLVASQEYIINSLTQGKPHIPELKGVCGNIYAVEYAAPLDSDQFLGVESVLSGQMSWNFRVRLALALLDVIEFAEETPYGTLHCCDVKESNFGVIEQDGELVVKMIDLDDSWFGPVISSLKFEAKFSNRMCKDNSNCNFDACHVECDTTTGKCSNKLLSNNLQVFCRRLLTKPHFRQPNLLQNPPTSIKQQLETLLDRCIDPKNVLTHVPRDLMRDLRTLLQSSI